MANFGASSRGREGIAPSGGALMVDRDIGAVRLWWQIWRWPTAVFAGVLLWLALVTIAGATTSAAQGAMPHACSPPTLSMPWVSQRNVLAAAQGHCGLRTGFTPRRP